MKKIIFLVSFTLLGCVTTMLHGGEQKDKGKVSGYESSATPDNQDTFLQPFKNDAYGQGIHSDATGRPFKWETQQGHTDPLLDVKPNAYGPDIGMDQYGRPVKPVPYP